MKRILMWSLPLVFSLLSACVQIIDDLSLNADGSGSLTYTINLSSSKIKINSILALDSLDGKRVPTKEEIESKIVQFKEQLALQDGISNVDVEADFTNYLFKLKCDFKNVVALQEGIKHVAEQMTSKKEVEPWEKDWVAWDGRLLVRNVPEVTVEQTRKIKNEDMELLKEGSYTSITRFSEPVVSFTNPKAVLSKNKQAVMVKTDTYSLLHNTQKLENTINLAD